MSQNRKQELLNSFIEIEALNKDQFLKVRETLTRIGLPSKRDGQQTLWQTCHVFHKQGRYYIVHFKQLFLLDGRTDVTDFSEEDEDRLEYIANLLEQWGLVIPVVEIRTDLETNVMIIPFREKQNWTLKVKYSLGNTEDRSNHIND